MTCYKRSSNGDIAGIDQLLLAGANVNCAIDGDGSPLIAAARTHRLAVVRHLLDRGADPNMPVPGDGSPLIAAASEGASAVAALLLDRGATVDLVVPGDENALIQASGSGHLDVVKLLGAHGADVNASVWVDSPVPQRPGEWRTPLSMARKGRHEAVVAFLSRPARASSGRSDRMSGPRPFVLSLSKHERAGPSFSLRPPVPRLPA